MSSSTEPSTVLGKRSAKEAKLCEMKAFLEGVDEITLGDFDLWYRWNKKRLIAKHVPEHCQSLREDLITFRAERGFKNDLEDKGCPPFHVYHSDFSELIHYNLVAGFLEDLVEDMDNKGEVANEDEAKRLVKALWDLNETIPAIVAEAWLEQ